MPRMPLVVVALCLFLLGASFSTKAEQADTILLGGQIITVDQSFSIHSALAIRNGRISAVGSDAEIRERSGPTTKVIELNGKTVIPGLIDNHVHIIRGARQWHRDVRLNAVHSRKEAKRRIAAKAKKLGPGEWVTVMGGFTPQQFDIERHAFTAQELDEIAPNNPVYIQVLFGLGYGNSAAFQTIGIDEDTDVAWLEIANDIELNEDERPTGKVRGAAMRRMLANIAEPRLEEAKSRTLALVSDMHAMGLTSAIDAAGSGVTLDYYDAVAALDAEKKLTLRIFSMLSPPGYEPGQETAFTSLLDELAFFQPSDYFQRIAVGERLYQPIHDSMAQPAADTQPHKTTFANLARQVAAKGYSLQQHATHPKSMKQHLDVYESLNQEYPLKKMRWAFHHADGIDKEIIQRAKALNMHIATHSRRLISGNLFDHPLAMLSFGNPPLRTLQESGIRWGLGTDTTVVNQSNPFYTLWWAVSGKAMNGDQLTEQTVSRKDALIAHTRSNAWMAFREKDLGSLEPGKYADLLVLDKNYLTVPEIEIRTIRPIITMVGGKIVYQTN